VFSARVFHETVQPLVHDTTLYIGMQAAYALKWKGMMNVRQFMFPRHSQTISDRSQFR
jgi:hypothetical protein